MLVGVPVSLYALFALLLLARCVTSGLKRHQTPGGPPLDTSQRDKVPPPLPHSPVPRKKKSWIHEGVLEIRYRDIVCVCVCDVKLSMNDCYIYCIYTVHTKIRRKKVYAFCSLAAYLKQKMQRQPSTEVSDTAVRWQRGVL